ncbi:alginate lyase family protein [Paraglaciecola sp.]|uniref:heparinase II/III family protein n=1 Tax=Paraglaciecola sp. TaxID=1920173 RepID=UPI00326376D1
MANELSWYINRLSCMSVGEVIYRTKTKLFTTIEKRKPSAEVVISDEQINAITLKFLPHMASQKLPEGNPDVLKVADNAVAGKLQVFTEVLKFDSTPSWNMDPKTGVKSPMIYGKTLNYRDESLVGDIKYLWEPSRHLHFPNLAFAYKHTQDKKYLSCLYEHMRSWIDECPHLMGPHWISSLELGIRLINWALTWSILGEQLQDLFDLPNGKQLQKDWLKVIKQHVEFIDGHYSRYSSANNHLIGEAAGVYIGSMVWPLDEKMTQSGAKAKTILEQEAITQNYSDGVNKEQAISYQQFVLDFLLMPYLIGQSYNDHFSSQYLKNIENMMNYLAALMDIKGNIPMIGDADDGYVFRFEGKAAHCPYKSLLATGAVLFNSPLLKSKVEAFDSRSWLLFGDVGLKSFNSLETSTTAFPIKTAFKEGGYYIIGDKLGTKDEYRMVMDIGPLGYGGIAAHGHADSLSLYLSVQGKEFLIDPGTYAYHTEKKWRDYFKGTSSHNTLRVDAKDQSVSGGNFMWVKKATSTLLKHEEQINSIELSGKHNGYASGKKPVGHERQLVLDKQKSEYLVTDKVTCRNDHIVEQFWHINEHCEVIELARNLFEISNGDQKISLKLDDAFDVKIEKANGDLPLGWASRAFDLKVPSYTIVGTSKVNNDKDFTTCIKVKI